MTVIDFLPTNQDRTSNFLKIWEIFDFFFFQCKIEFSYMLSNEILRFLSEIEIAITTGGH